MRGQGRGWSAVEIAALLLFACACNAAQKKQPAAPSADAGASPAAQIEVAPLGYEAPNASYLRLRFSFNSLDFIDDNHLLFTFYKNELLPRLPGDPADDNDQMIHAVVLDIKTGKALRQADWRMHDRQRYLWALRDGQFLVRVRNDLYFTDSTLEFRPYLKLDADVEAVEVSPSRKLLLIEVKKPLPAPEESGAAAPPSLRGDGNARQTRTEMLMVRPGTTKVLAGAETLNPGYVPLLEDGLLETDEGKKPKQWMVVEDLFDKTTNNIGEVESGCAPRLVTLSDTVALAQNCAGHGGGGTDATALSMTGGILWRQKWDPRYIWPNFESAENGSRFGYESLAMDRDVGTLDYFGEEDVTSQPVGVFDTETGKLVLVRDASPILSAGQNFALSADGRRFAILRKGAIEVYDLPPVVLAAKPPVANGKRKK